MDEIERKAFSSFLLQRRRKGGVEVWIKQMFHLKIWTNTDIAKTVSIHLRMSLLMATGIYTALKSSVVEMVIRCSHGAIAIALKKRFTNDEIGFLYTEYELEEWHSEKTIRGERIL